MNENATDRRNFLKSAGAAALTSSIFTGKIRGANDRIRIGFIGTGVMGVANVGAAMRQSGVEVAAVCDVYQPNLERGAAAARRGGQQPKEIRDFREIIADKSIDAVCISTPDHWHPYQTIEACKAGKDVYVEKPVCLAINEGVKMVEAARKYDRVVQAGTWQRSGEHFQKACEIVRTGQLGKVTFSRTWMYDNSPARGIGNPPDASPPPDLDWELWLGPAPARPFNPNRFGVYPKAYSYFRWFWDYAGGQLTDSGVHMIDIMQMAFNDEVPKAIVALGGKYWYTDNRETPDTMLVTYEYDGWLGSWEHRNNNMSDSASRMLSVSFHGTHGSLYLNRNGYRIEPEPGSPLEASEMKRTAPPHPLHWANFVECIRSRQRPNSDIETCFRSSVTSILGNVSYLSKHRLDWDQKARTTLQEEPRKYLNREYPDAWKLVV